jgi:hypothetical protein
LASIAGTAIHYRLGDLEIELQWEKDFPHPSRAVLRPTQPPEHGVQGLFPRGKAAMVWYCPPTYPI